MAEERKRKPRIDTYTDKLAKQFCARIASGRSMTSVCADYDMPSSMLVHQWRRERPEFAQQYTEAIQDRADILVEEILEIADKESSVPRARLKTDVRKWAAARMNPNSWGDKQQHQLSGKDGGPIEQDVQVTLVRANDDKG